ncbi:hypothetical protein GQE99_06605 [Maritimibacter sp. DP07]|uniref:Uncharacterized protein n=1 Tax=Maritimibacter harenae TaxID=2606218 RepID=A0A845LXK5_9RHOB|nr:hypothetical protein [Maritimibacter harenae]MZR12690.1 hypothetical protein [Maritimibacter harenae]
MGIHIKHHLPNGARLLVRAVAGEKPAPRLAIGGAPDQASFEIERAKAARGLRAVRALGGKIQTYRGNEK